MTEFEKQKFEIEELLLLLEPYTDGELSFLLNATENVDIVHDRLIAFDMEDASKKEYFPLVAIITLQMIVDKIKKRQGFAKELIIDEALDFLQDEKFGDFIAYLYRTFRKKEGSITLAAQNILFLKNMPSSIKDSIIINCATKDYPRPFGTPAEPAGSESRAFHHGRRGLYDRVVATHGTLERVFHQDVERCLHLPQRSVRLRRRSLRFAPGDGSTAEAVVQRKRLDLYGHQPLSGGKEEKVWMTPPKG